MLESLRLDTQRDTRRDPLASSSGILSGVLGGIPCGPRHPLASYSGGILGGIHWRATLRILGGIHWPAALARRDPLASYSGILSGILGGIHWRAALVGYSAGPTCEPLSAGCTGGSGGIPGGLHWRAALAGYWAGSTGQLLWRDTRQDPLASRSGGILGGIDWRAALTGEQLWRDTGRDPLASSSGGILVGVHWRAALAGAALEGYWVGAWCRSADSNITSNNPFLSGGEKSKRTFQAPTGPNDAKWFRMGFPKTIARATKFCHERKPNNDTGFSCMIGVSEPHHWV